MLSPNFVTSKQVRGKSAFTTQPNSLLKGNLILAENIPRWAISN